MRPPAQPEELAHCGRIGRASFATARALWRRSTVAQHTILGTLTFCLLLALVWWLQPYKVGFEPGHHGWVSSHTLAIIGRATPAREFVGYAQEFRTGDGVSRVYFDRHPALFAAGMNAGLSLSGDTFAERVFAARQLMNVIYVLTGVFSYLFLLSVLRSRPAAFVATLLTLSGWYFAHYKDMVHFDQPAVLGLAMTYFGIASFELEDRRGPLFAASLAAPLLGLGYVSVITLAFWSGVRVARRSRSSSETITLVEPFAATLLAGTLAASALLYNTVVEARGRNVPLAETSIVESATRRLGLSSSFNEEYSPELAWSSFLSSQAQRAYDGMWPLAFHGGFDALDRRARNPTDASRVYSVARETYRVGGQIVVAGVLLVGIGVLVRLDQSRRWVVGVVAASGIVWLLLMRNLAAFHDYTAIYLLGAQLSVFGGFALYCSRRFPRVSVAGGLTIFVASLVVNHTSSTAIAKEVNSITEEFQTIRNALQGTRAAIYAGSTDDHWHFLEGRPFALGFYGSEYEFVLQEDEAAFVLTNQSVDPPPGANLTPENGSFFLYRRQPIEASGEPAPQLP